jgi:hypothetical protein
MADTPEYRRITVYSKKDPKSGAYPVRDYERDFRSYVNNALKSSLPKDAFYYVSNKQLSSSGRARWDIYVHPEHAGNVSKAFSQESALHTFKGSTNEKYQSTKVVRLTEDEIRLVSGIESAKNQKEEETETTRFNKGMLVKLLGSITALTAVTRRILSSLMGLASQAVQDTITAHNLGTTREAIRQYRHVETIHGLKEGTITGALSDIQNKFGNITSLDEKSLEALAVVMGSKIEEMATMGIGSSNPERILESIIDTFNERANAGINSIGQYVGEQQARRELYSYLLKISPQMADIFATMQEEQHNINSLFRNQADTFAEWKRVLPTARGAGKDSAGNNVLVTLGQEWNVIKSTIEQVRDAIAVTLAPALLKILRRIADTRIGMSQTEKEERNKENRKANEDFISSAQATMSLMQKDWDNLSPEQKARYWALEDAVREAQQANKGKGLFNKSIPLAVPTQEELQVATQAIIYEKAKERAQQGKDESAYRYLDDITEEEIQATAEGNVYDIAGKKKEYDKERGEYIAERTDTENRLKQSVKAVKEAKKGIDLNKVVSQANREAKVVTQQEWLRTLMAVEQVFGVDFEHDSNGNEVGLHEALKKAVSAGYIKFDKLGYDVIKPMDVNEQEIEEAFPDFWSWIYKNDPYFFNEKILLKRAEKMSDTSKLDPYYDWMLLHQDYGADFEKIADKLPTGYNTSRAGIFSYDEKSDNGVVTHKIVLDLNNNGKLEASDVLLESFVTNRTGFIGTLTDKVEIRDGKVNSYANPASTYVQQALNNARNNRR